MHMADALVSPAVSGIMYACSIGAISYSVKKVRLENDSKKIPLMGVMGAFVFAAQMVNFTVPGTGSSGHLCGGMLLSAVLGPYAGFLTMVSVLAIQCLMFADGGLLALGCNIWNMAFYGCFIGAMLIWKAIMKKEISRQRIITASIIGSIVTLQLGAFSVVLETLASGVTELPFAVFAGVMQPIHLAIGLVEGLITAAVLCFIYEARPELLWGNRKEKINTKVKLSYKKVLIILAVATTITGGIISLGASANPDGLEWSIKKVTGLAELQSTGWVHAVSEKIQQVTAVLPDYAFKNSDAASGTMVSGIIGGIAVVLLCIAVCYGFKFFKGREING